MISIPDLVKEHEEIRGLLNEFEEFFEQEDLDHHGLVATLRELQILWDVHEEKEEELFKQQFNKEEGHQSYVKMFIEQHKQLRGHWKILLDSVESGTEEDVKVSLDTDGKMLVDKLRRHMEEEDLFMGTSGNGNKKEKTTKTGIIKSKKKMKS